MESSGSTENENESDGGASFVLPSQFDNAKLMVTSSRVMTCASQLDDQQTSQLQFLIDSPEYWWLDSIKACFDQRKVDDGMLVHKVMASPNDEEPLLILHYWAGYFGGNPRGYLLIPTTNDSSWEVLIENCDTDFIWRGKGISKVPKAFMKRVKMAAYGGKYRKEDGDD